MEQITKKIVEDFIKKALASPSFKGKLDITMYVPKEVVNQMDAVRMSIDPSLPKIEKIFLLADDIQHCFLQHGVGNENNENQIPLTKEDMLLIAKVIKTPEVVIRGTNSNGTGVGVYLKKKFREGEMFCILISMYMNKAHLHNRTSYMKKLK